ncbi:hypothetical protein FQA39_LY18596 [Lamprigera yunnana]|nr:hypothetical protein FQA39_LY18596 [Lamprigera yunnana]
MWMLYAEEHWTKAIDLKSAVERLYEKLGALEFDADHEAIYGMEIYYTVQQCEELRDKYKIGRKARLFTREDRDDTVYAKIKKKFFNHGFDAHQFCMYNQSVLDEYALFATLDLFYANMQIAKKKVRVIMDTSLIGAQHRVLTTKAGSYLYPSVKNIVTALTESGLIEYEKNEFQKYIKKKIGKFYDNQMDGANEEPIVLTLEHVYPIFVFWGAGVIIATLVFVAEVIAHRVQNR